MTTEEREKLIERHGILATDLLQELKDQVEELYEYLEVNRIAQARGFVLQRKPEMKPLTTIKYD